MVWEIGDVFETSSPYFVGLKSFPAGELAHGSKREY
jgi:hypothetical protein